MEHCAACIEVFFMSAALVTLNPDLHGARKESILLDLPVVIIDQGLVGTLGPLSDLCILHIRDDP